MNTRRLSGNAGQKALAWTLALVMLLALLPLSARAADETPSTVVTTASDVVSTTDGKISLREAVAYAGADGLGNAVTFSASLKKAELTLASPLTIGKTITVTLSEQTLKAAGNVAAIFQMTDGGALTVSGKGALQGGAAAVAGSGTYSVTFDLDGTVAAGVALNLSGTPTLSLRRGEFTGTAAEGAIVAGGTLDSLRSGSDAEVKPTASGAYAAATAAQLALKPGADTGENGLRAYGYRFRPTAELAAPEGLQWKNDDSFTAQWTAVANAAGYTVRLYKDGAVSGDPATLDASATEHAFPVTIDGTYTFTVQATHGTTAYVDSLESGPSAARVRDTTMPTITAGDAVRTSGTEATVSFTSSEAGQYYTVVQDPALTMPIIDTSGKGTACTAGENTASLTGLSGGSLAFYLVVKDAAGNVSSQASASIPAPTLAVTLPTGTGYTVSAEAGSASPVVYGGSYYFTVTIASGYHKTSAFAVKANGSALTASAGGVYSLTGITAAQTVTVEGVELISAPTTYTVTLPTGTGYTVAPVSGSGSPVVSGGTYNFTVAVASGYHKTSAFAVKVNGTAVTDASGVYTIPGITENKTITVEGVEINAVTYPVTLTGGTGYTLAASGSSVSPVTTGGSYSFTVAILSGYHKTTSFAVKANGAALTASSAGVYTISGITAAQTVTVEGVAADAAATYTVTLPKGTGYTTTITGGSSSPVASGGSFSFTVNISSGYTKGTAFAVKANGVSLTPSSSVYTISGITSDQTVTVSGVVAATTTVPAAPSITTTELPAGKMGADYKQTLAATGSTPITWSFTGTLPTGVTLNTTSGVLSGTPTLDGTYRFTVKATNSTGSSSRQLTITVSGTDYQITEGQSSEWTGGSATGLTFATAGKGDYVKTQVDGVDVPDGKMDLSGDKKTVTLHADYLEKLTAGAHSLTMVFKDGYAKTKFTTLATDPTVIPTITTQPLDSTVKTGESVTFSVKAEGTTPLLCQWQVDKGDGAGWTDITGAASASYTIAKTEAGQNGYKYRCVVKNSAGSTQSNTATLTISDAAENTPAADTGKTHSGRWIWIVLLVLALGGVAAVVVIYLKRRADTRG